MQPASPEVAQQPAPATVAEESLRDVYEQSCAKLGCRPNTTLQRMLPADAAAASQLHELDLGLNFVGALGVRAVLDVVRAAPRLTHLSLRDNYINNAVAVEVVRALDGHPSLVSLDLSNNPMSVAAARLLVPFLQRNPRLRQVELAGTLISPAMSVAVQRAAEANALLEASTAGGHGALVPGSVFTKRRSRLHEHIRTSTVLSKRPEEGCGIEPAAGDVLLAFACDKMGADGDESLSALSTLLSVYE